MTPYDRELGSLSAKLASEIHARRNMRMIQDGLVTELIAVRTELNRLRTVIRTTLSVLAVAVAVLAWLAEMALQAP
jgi:hypothetical protein